MMGTVGLLWGCGTLPPGGGVAAESGVEPAFHGESTTTTCTALFQSLDTAIARAGVADAQSQRIAGLPYLRINRFLAALTVDPAGPGFELWVDQLRALARAARRAELANLPSRIDLDRQLAATDRCAARLRAADLSDPARRAALLATTVADAYHPLQRMLGLYPLTSQAFLLGVYGLHRETARTFATPLEQLAVHGRVQRFEPAPGPSPAEDRLPAAVRRSAANALGVPLPDPDTLADLFIAHAPVFEVDVVSPADLPGQPRLDGQGSPAVTGEARVYTLVSHARWRGTALLQLNYVLWFPARPRQGPLDLVGGPIDGITWRVTLGPDGRPLLYDAMHNCGCYYKAFPTPRARVTERHRGWQEPISVPQQVPDGAGRLVLRLASTSHYLERVYRRSADGAPSGGGGRRTPATSGYQLADYDELRSLPAADGGRRSFFRGDGIVAGSERRERWVFWPMGVPEPGAMRQWGNHAIAFVGRRHFDDADLLERHFAPAGTDP
ncbi:MAG: hypothetical protein GVY21_09100 [Gammaproteobacteria bacterium]|nr:hypothetical protein [Gammaproteobacteria bacterium]